MKPIPFGKYTLLERISHGGMAEVFRARTTGEAGFERTVAIKLLLPVVATDEEFITMLIDEAKIAAQLNHANIAQIFDLGVTEGRHYIVQEFVSGRDVRSILRDLTRSGRRFSVAHACHIMLKIAEGLDYAHNKHDASGRPLKLVHRDVSPQNILISDEGEVKLIDFGIAKAEGRATKTLAGLVKGKFAYMSPEQIRGLPVDRRSDVFACGIILHELLSNRPLFRRQSEFETLKRARSAEAEPPSHFNSEVPRELDAVVLKALARLVDDRYQAAVELRDALWKFIHQHEMFVTRSDLANWLATVSVADTSAQSAELSQPSVEIITDSEILPKRKLAGARNRVPDDDEDEDSDPDNSMTIVDPHGPGGLIREPDHADVDDLVAPTDHDAAWARAAISGNLAPASRPRSDSEPTPTPVLDSESLKAHVSASRARTAKRPDSDAAVSESTTSERLDVEEETTADRSGATSNQALLQSLATASDYPRAITIDGGEEGPTTERPVPSRPVLMGDSPEGPTVQQRRPVAPGAPPRHIATLLGPSNKRDATGDPDLIATTPVAAHPANGRRRRSSASRSARPPSPGVRPSEDATARAKPRAGNLHDRMLGNPQIDFYTPPSSSFSRPKSPGSSDQVHLRAPEALSSTSSLLNRFGEPPPELSAPPQLPAGSTEIPRPPASDAERAASHQRDLSTRNARRSGAYLLVAAVLLLLLAGAATITLVVTGHSGPDNASTGADNSAPP